jgi:hypothetical protein
MKKLTTRLMIATAALVVVVGAASAQSMTASIPFEFRAGNRVMAPGEYRIDDLGSVTGTPVYRFWNVHSGGRVLVIGQVQVDPEKTWTASGEGKLVFACTSGSCALAELYSGSGSRAYKFRGPKPGKDETAILTEIPMQPGKGE